MAARPGPFLGLMALIVLVYVCSAELLKQAFYRKHALRGTRLGRRAV